MTDDRGTFRSDRPLPVGKLPPALLGRLLTSYAPDDPALIVGPGIGRDAAALAVGGTVLVAKTDPITFASRDAAAYLVEVNANDIACLGARPRWLLVTTLLAPGTTESEVEAQFAALTAACDRRGITLVGGHSEVTAGLDRTFLVGLMLGETTPGRLLRPGGAKAGDRLLLSKGLAVEGTALLANELGPELADLVGVEAVERARWLLVDPGISVVREAEALLDGGDPRALHDPTEGGLATAVRELAGASGCGALVAEESVPILPETQAICAALGLDPIGLLASGSLLVAAPPEAVAGLIDAAGAAGVALTEIGGLVPPEQGFTLSGPEGQRRLPEFDTDEASRAIAEARHRPTTTGDT